MDVSGFFDWTSLGRKKPSKMELLLLPRSSGCKFVVSKQALLELVQQALLGLAQQALFGTTSSVGPGVPIENQHIKG